MLTPRLRRSLLGLATVAAVLAAGTPASSADPISDLRNDLQQLGSPVGDFTPFLPVRKAASPPFDAVPRAQCAPGAKPEPDIQGRVPPGSAVNGLWCNMTLVAHEGNTGGFKTFDYVDAQGHECAFYDTTLLFPSNAANIFSSGLGVAVLDLSDPTHPVRTTTLTSPSMLSPHESLNLNAKRGILGAVSGNPGMYPGFVSFYDVHADCRHPTLDFGGVIAPLGHESGFSEDGRTFWASGTAFTSLTAIDVTDPKLPVVLWQGAVQTHGLTLSADGNRAYLANPDYEKGDLTILDVSEVQARKLAPSVRTVSRTTWDRVSIPQNAIPFTRGGHPYVLEFDEFNGSTLDPNGDANDVGAARILDIADERQPTIVSNIRLQVNSHENHAAYNSEVHAGSLGGYEAHYCNIDSRVDPKLAACSFIGSGLRLFDISDVAHPREVGYFVAPSPASSGNYAMSQPAFIPSRRQIVYSDGNSGFYEVQVDPSVWP